ncbi:TRADD-N-associated membrane domain-containing protein [Sphaerospermopsis kisseleviana]|uniref:TRADD-N-associated membrane domain-containing protein n=1 Tax=Sphaerospermopsis kisseleviana TaxID=289435 RepID=UPI00390842BB
MSPEQEKQAFNAYIWQIQLGYKVKIAIGTLSAVFTFGSVCLFYNGKIEQSHLNIGIGVISSLVGFKSANDSKNELKELLESCEIVDSGN